MGNVNGRQDGVDEEEEGDEGSVGGGGSGHDGVAHDSRVPRDVAHVGYHVPELMNQSPPHSPRATQSPLMFTPQIPEAPLQRPDEMHVQSPSWMQTSSAYEDVCREQGIPTMITWSYGGKEVILEGSWDNWRSRVPLQRSGKDFTIMKVLPSGVYRYRFIVDGQWKYSPDMPWAQEEGTAPYNILDLKEYVPEDLESISSFEPPLSPDSSYTNYFLGAEDYAKEPPLAPRHLESTPLNVPPNHIEFPVPVSRPQHVVLNHLYMQKGKNGPSVVALGTTERFMAKYVTVVLYKSLQR